MIAWSAASFFRNVAKFLLNSHVNSINLAISTDMLFVCFKGRLFRLCLIDVLIFAVFSNVMNLLCELPFGGIQFGDPDLFSDGFETGVIHRWHGVLGVRMQGIHIFDPRMKVF